MKKEFNDIELDEVVVCKWCNRKELYGHMMWLDGRCECRECYKEHTREIKKRFQSDCKKREGK